MNTRRDFIKKAALLAGGTGMLHTMPSSVQRALAINPDPGSTFYDAEHVVLLMQENRSFDHLFGSLQGVRGFNDPRAINLPNKNLVWLQSNAKGETYLPFHLDIKDTKATWMSYLPHTWASQVDARNNGRHDHWLEAKRSYNKDYKDIPLTMGHYTREDLPFYYALADAFTVCDQHFCASLTATSPNRVYFWTGTVRAKPEADSPANILNSDVYYDSPGNWGTFPEILEDNGISWKVYQNELSVGVGFTPEEDSWLANYSDNPLEWFTQYHAEFLPAHIKHLRERVIKLTNELNSPSINVAGKAKRQRALNRITEDLDKLSAKNFDNLSQREKNLHNKAFVTNINDSHYHELASLQYKEGDIERELNVPKGDVLYQFREDVKNGNLPMISWIVAPENFSDHPSAPWYGAWYDSEVLDILTRNPEVWKKTILILTYDENDGYFDHIPPFVAPEPNNKKTGFCSNGMSTEVDYVTRQQEEALKGTPKDPGRVSPIGLGFRVPLVVASPWSRGGWVNSQVFDHTSVLGFMENLLTKKTGKEIKETNISAWRRMICGDLTSVFRPYNGEETTLPSVVKKDPFFEGIYNAKFKPPPSDYEPVSSHEIEKINQNPDSSSWMSYQEKGIRHSCALPYQLYAEGRLIRDKKMFEIQLAAKKQIFGKISAGAPFTVYEMQDFQIRNYGVAAGDQLTDAWDLQDFDNGQYHIRIYGPNGFFRAFKGNLQDPDIEIQCAYEHKTFSKNKLTGNVELNIKNNSLSHSYKVEITDNAYKTNAMHRTIPSGKQERIVMDIKPNFGWYDFTVKVEDNDHFEKRYAGHVESGINGFTDPVMGRMI